MTIFSSKKRAAAIGAVTAATLLGGTVAFAYWTASGNDTGTATTGTSSDYVVEIDPSGTTVTGGDLAPEGPAQVHQVKVTNQGTGAQQVQSVVVRIGTSDSDNWEVRDSNNVLLCSAADYRVVTLTDTLATSADVLANDTTLGTAPGTNSLTVPVSIKMIDTGDNQNGCKGLKNVPLYASVN